MQSKFLFQFISSDQFEWLPRRKTQALPHRLCPAALLTDCSGGSSCEQCAAGGQNRMEKCCQPCLSDLSVPKSSFSLTALEAFIAYCGNSGKHRRWCNFHSESK